MHFLPMAVIAAIGDAVGAAAFWLIPERRRVTRVNLAKCFPQMDPRERERLARAHFRAFCRSFVERGILWWAPRERIERALAAARVEWRDAPGGYGLVVQGSRPRELPGFAEGGFIVQGPGQARLLTHAAVPAGARVWDCCAAPGGKAVVLSARGPVLASDRGSARLARLAETVRRAAPMVSVFAADARQPPLAAGSVDAVWLDAPCTATGTMGRHPDARWRVSPRRLEVARRQQATLLDGVAAVVRSGGLLVYTTCSLEPEENQAQVEAFLSRHPAFGRDRDDLAVWPPDTGSDGGFIAVLRRA
ncbi:MAG: hypothetical protein HYT81_08640 [Gemmatimonadetes bacterium]|nr:hypothetical protein [Gemmatimonadota bacterium]